MNEEEVKRLINKFVAYEKILYDENTEEIMILNNAGAYRIVVGKVSESCGMSATIFPSIVTKNTCRI